MQIWPKNYRLWALFYYKWTRNALFTWYCHDVAWCHWSAQWLIYENFSPLTMLCSLNLNFPSKNVPERQTLALICHFRALLCLKTTRNALFTWHDFQYGDVSSWKADMGKIMKIPARNSYFSIKLCCKTRLECKYGHKITTCGLCFAINRPEMHFLCGFMVILAPGRHIWVELWRSRP